MNRIEEAIQKAKVAKAVREREAEREALRSAERAPAAEHPPPARVLRDAAAEEHARGVRVEPIPRAPVDETLSRGRPVPVAEPPAAPVAEAYEAQSSPQPPTVSVDATVLERAGLWPDEEHARRLADEFRVAKRAVLGGFARQSGPGATRRVVAVTSALAGEGKSFSSLHLALSIAMERGLRVVLADGDGARPTLTRAFGCEGEPGLLDCLERNLALDAVLRPTSVERLWFLPAGAAEHGAAELLSSPQMGLLLDRAAAKFRELVVVVDTPPLLLTVEARALLDAASQVLLVVKANSTPEGAILQALDQMGEDRPIQLLLNQRRESRLDSYQYYYSYPANAGPHAPESH